VMSANSIDGPSIYMYIDCVCLKGANVPDMMENVDGIVGLSVVLVRV